MIDSFLTALQTEINKYYTCYYEESPSDAAFPFLVIPTLNLTPLYDGYQGIFDIEIYINELSDQTVESIMDNLREKLEGYSYHDNNIGFHIGFENQIIVKSNEQDLSVRRMSFVARIFK